MLLPWSLLKGGTSGEDDADEGHVAHESHEIPQLKQEPITPLGLGGDEQRQKAEEDCLRLWPMTPVPVDSRIS